MYFVYDFLNNNNNRPNIAVKSDSLYACYGPTCKRLILLSMLYCAFATVVFMLLRFFLLMIKDLHIFGTSGDGERRFYEFVWWYVDIRF